MQPHFGSLRIATKHIYFIYIALYDHVLTLQNGMTTIYCKCKSFQQHSWHNDSLPIPQHISHWDHTAFQWFEYIKYSVLVRTYRHRPMLCHVWCNSICLIVGKFAILFDGQCLLSVRYCFIGICNEVLSRYMATVYIQTLNVKFAHERVIVFL